ncbi:hypothetical protein DFS33DRAFT_1304646 [Desarmillaria ectypa]|nr:hypothetical protein DFS33DRAFT_1304646 [Desarmillaria ectypa]
MDSKIITTSLRYIRYFLLNMLNRYFFTVQSQTNRTHVIDEYDEKASSPLVASVHCFGPCVDAPFSCVYHAFSSVARVRPTQIAIVDHLRHSLSYGELDSLSSRLASFLRARGVRPGYLVALVGQRSIHQEPQANQRRL